MFIKPLQMFRCTNVYSRGLQEMRTHHYQVLEYGKCDQFPKSFQLFTSHFIISQLTRIEHAFNFDSLQHYASNQPKVVCIFREIFSKNEPLISIFMYNYHLIKVIVHAYNVTSLNVTIAFIFVFSLYNLYNPMSPVYQHKIM